MGDAAIANYHIKSAEPQAFHLDVDGVVGKLVSPELIPTIVNVQDLPDSSFIVDFHSDGITFEHHVTQIRDFDGSSDWEDIYDNEGRPLLGHIALDMEDTATNRATRKSIETRTLVRYS